MFRRLTLLWHESPGETARAATWTWTWTLNNLWTKRKRKKLMNLRSVVVLKPDNERNYIQLSRDPMHSTHWPPCYWWNTLQQSIWHLFSRTWLRYIRLRPTPVVCLPVTLLHRKQTNFPARFLHRLIAQGLGQFVLKFWAKIRRSSSGSCKLHTRWYGKLAFFDQYLALFRKR